MAAAANLEKPDENGWKSRIAFPHKKTETEEAEKEAAEKLADDPSIYNPR